MRKGAILKQIPLPPPAIPQLAEMSIIAGATSGYFSGENSGQAKMTRLQCELVAFTCSVAKALPQFGETLHGPKILFVAKGAKYPFPQGLLPTCFPGPRLEMRRLGLKTNERRLVQQLSQAFGAQFTQWPA